MSIVSTYHYPPIPDRSHDWSASFDWMGGDDDGPRGWGATEREAVLDLMQQAAEWDSDTAALDEVIDLAMTAWDAQQESKK